MPIPESQLITWSSPGAQASSSIAYNSIKTALAAPTSKVLNVAYEPFLQGSYRNATNIYADSDVDIVLKLTSAFSRDLSALDEYQRVLEDSSYSNATYGWHRFRADVLQSLEAYYGKARVKPCKRCIQVETGPGRITADVIPAVEHWKYDYFYSATLENHTKGVKFYDSNGNPIVNFPKQHIENGEAKNGVNRTNSWYKDTVRVFKNARNRLVTHQKIADDYAPSYCVECLVYNAPDSCFGGSYGDTYCAVWNHLWQTPMTSLISQNGIIPLVGDSPVQWKSDATLAFLIALRDLWNDWK